MSSARRLWNVISRCRPPPDQSVPRERSKRSFFSRRARSKSSLELATIQPNQPVQEGEVGEDEGEQGENVDGVSAVLTFANRRLNMMTISVLPCIIQSTPERIKANSEMILPLTRRARHLVIALPLPTSIAKIIERSGSDLYNLEFKNPHLVPRIPVPNLQMHPNPEYCAIPGTGILAYLQHDLPDLQSILLLAAMKM